MVVSVSCSVSIFSCVISKAFVLNGSRNIVQEDSAGTHVSVVCMCFSTVHSLGHRA